MKRNLTSLLTLVTRSGVTAALAAAFGCSGAQSVSNCTYGIDPVSLQCLTAPSNDTSGNQTDDSGGEPEPEPDVIELPDVVDLPDIVDVGLPDNGPVVAEDVGGNEPQDVRIDGQCNPTLDPMNLRAGMPCTGHTDCETCYCYDEAYLAWGASSGGGSFRFCTQKCEQGAGSSCSELGLTTDEYKCVRFAQQNINDYGLTVEAICMPYCDDASSCEKYGPQYDECGTSWDGKSIQATPTCQVKVPE